MRKEPLVQKIQVVKHTKSNDKKGCQIIGFNGNIAKNARQKEAEAESTFKSDLVCHLCTSAIRML